jgi:hypothetical protein
VTVSAVDFVEAQCHGSIWTEIKVVTLQRVKMGMFAKIRRSFSPSKIRRNSFLFTFVTSAKLNISVSISVRHVYKDIVTSPRLPFPHRNEEGTQYRSATPEFPLLTNVFLITDYFQIRSCFCHAFESELSAGGGTLTSIMQYAIKQKLTLLPVNVTYTQRHIL